MRLDKFIADGAALSRKDSRDAIKKGLVRVEGQVIRDIAFQIDENASVTLNGENISYVKHVYIMLNKPAGYVSATEDTRQKTVLELLDPKFKRYSLFPVGRLDIDTEGFLLLTNNGTFAHDILSPSKKVGKTYFVELENEISDNDIALLEKGVDIGECITKPAKVKRMSANEIMLTITEGKFHQIKRMAHSIKNNVAYLKRVAYGNLYLDETLKKGEYKVIDEEIIMKEI